MYLTTVTGELIDVQNIVPSQVSILDIAHSLSNKCRFGGHSRVFYSVAQHSVRVAWALPPRLRLAGLLHDASETYLEDVPRPVKRILVGYSDLERRVMQVVSNRFDLGDLVDDPLIHEADNRVLRTEWEELMPGPVPEGIREYLPVEKPPYHFTPSAAYALFLGTFNQLRGS